jgi:hypothetical protein
MSFKAFNFLTVQLTNGTFIKDWDYQNGCLTFSTTDDPIRAEKVVPQSYLDFLSGSRPQENGLPSLVGSRMVKVNCQYTTHEYDLNAVDGAELRANEIELIKLITDANKTEGYDKIIATTRRSNVDFDVWIKFMKKGELDKKIWLPLAGIKHLIAWQHPNVATLTSNPEGVKAGYWSNIRDDDPKVQWNIFNKYVLPLLNMQYFPPS